MNTIRQKGCTASCCHVPPLFSARPITIRMFSIGSWTFPIIEDNLITGNETEDLLYCSGQKASPVFRTNRILNNEITDASKRIFYLYDAEAKIYNNLIANNLGWVAHINGGKSSFTNNTYR